MAGPDGPSGSTVRAPSVFLSMVCILRKRARYSSADEPTDPTSNTLEIPSSWLQRFPTRVSIHEYSTSKSASRSPSIAKDLFTADIPILVLNPLSTPPSSVLSSHHLPTAHPHAIYVLTSSPSSKTPNLTKYAKRTVVVDPTRALAATRALASSPSSAVAVQRYQDDYTASGLSSIGQSIDSVLSSSPPSTPPLVSLRLRKAQYIVRTALALSEASLDAARSEVDAAFMGASELRTLVEEARVRVPVQVLGEDAKGEVREALRRARKEVALTMDGLSWWRALWRVDDIRHIVGAAVERAWCRDLERKVRMFAFPSSYVSHSDVLAELAHIPLRHPLSPPTLADPNRAQRPIALRRTLPPPLAHPPQRARPTAHRAHARAHAPHANDAPPHAPRPARAPDRRAARGRAARGARRAEQRPGGRGRRVGGVGRAARGGDGHERRDGAWGGVVGRGGGRAVGGEWVGEGEEAVVEGLG